MTINDLARLGYPGFKSDESSPLPAAALGDGYRILIYSHDSFGLGHLRRCRVIAHALVEHRSNLSVLILSGSPIIGSFDFRSRVDFVRVPGVIKLRNGEYTALNLHIGLQQTLAIRASIIEHTAEVFEPHLFLVDKEPLGLRGEIEPTLAFLKEQGTPLVLGLRDVMDEPELLLPEWERKNAMPALSKYYDSIWVYGLPQICDPLAGLSVPNSIRRKMVYTGYLRRELPQRISGEQGLSDKPYILVTPGGGGDGEALVDWVLRVYEQRPMPGLALVVTGPFMQPDKQAEFQQRATRLSNAEVLTFDAHPEYLMAGAAAVVAMGGYNTFCEILSFDKRTLLVPRTEPRREQLIRAVKAQNAGLLTMLEDDGVRDVDQMATALRQLLQQNKPSDVVVPGLLDGLENVNRLFGRLVDKSAMHQRSSRVKAV
ncbi:MAG: glycosyltransferase [Rhodospirillaceae bacterium]|nr:glycosyltransferase [Rhodospirillaceae bacterium]